jgi:hypothetical protein
MMNENPMIVEVAKLDARPGDVILVRVQAGTSEETGKEIADELRRYFPGVMVLVLAGVDIQVGKQVNMPKGYPPSMSDVEYRDGEDLG